MNETTIKTVVESIRNYWFKPVDKPLTMAYLNTVKLHCDGIPYYVEAMTVLNPEQLNNEVEKLQATEAKEFNSYCDRIKQWITPTTEYITVDDAIDYGLIEAFETFINANGFKDINKQVYGHYCSFTGIPMNLCISFDNCKTTTLFNYLTETLLDLTIDKYNQHIVFEHQMRFYHEIDGNEKVIITHRKKSVDANKASLYTADVINWLPIL